MTRTKRGIFFTFPVDGLMLTDAAGEKTDGGLLISARVDAPEDSELYLNGVGMSTPSSTMFNMFRADTVLSPGRNVLELKDKKSGFCLSITVFYLEKACRKYRVSLDDNIWFLQNVNEHKDVYPSIFCDPYLAMIKDIHDRFGSKFHINVYYRTDRHGGFDLSQMTDKFRNEFIANSDWIRMSFHADADEPPRPYAHASYEKTFFEADRINREIIRFAGEETFSKTVCTVHCGDISIEGARALRDLGYRALLATYEYLHKSGLDIRTYLDAEQCVYLQRYGFWYDKDTDICHFKYNGGIQHSDPGDFAEIFSAQEKDMPAYLFKDLCLHEQYFYPEFRLYQNNYPKKLETACLWLKDNGYEPIFMDELFGFDTHRKK